MFKCVIAVRIIRNMKNVNTRNVNYDEESILIIDMLLFFSNVPDVIVFVYFVLCIK